MVLGIPLTQQDRRLHKYRQKALRKLGAEQLGSDVVANTVGILHVPKSIAEL